MTTAFFTGFPGFIASRIIREAFENYNYDRVYTIVLATQLEKAQQAEKIIRAAKRALQQHQNMTEDEAHRYIQKRSMELRISKLEFAKRILKIYQKKG